MNELAFERDYTALLTGAPQLQAALSAKITERDSLSLWNAKPKGHLFFSIGVYAYKGFALYCHLQRIKRKIEPVQGYLNRDEAVIMPAVEDLHTGLFLGRPNYCKAIEIGIKI